MLVGTRLQCCTAVTRANISPGNPLKMHYLSPAVCVFEEQDGTATTDRETKFSDLMIVVEF